MRKLIFFVIPVFVIFLSIKTSFAAGEVTVNGILIDTKCYGMNHNNFTNEHMTPDGEMPKCATMCAKMGVPVGLLVDGKVDGKVYFLAIPAPPLADYMGKTVRVKGLEAYKNGLIPEKIELIKGDEYEEINIKTMM